MKEGLVMQERECHLKRSFVNTGQIHPRTLLEKLAHSHLPMKAEGLSAPEMALASPWPAFPAASSTR